MRLFGESRPTPIPTPPDERIESGGQTQFTAELWTCNYGQGSSNQKTVNEVWHHQEGLATESTSRDTLHLPVSVACRSMAGEHQYCTNSW